MEMDKGEGYLRGGCWSGEICLSFYQKVRVI